MLAILARASLFSPYHKILFAANTNEDVLPVLNGGGRPHQDFSLSPSHTG